MEQYGGLQARLSMKICVTHEGGTGVKASRQLVVSDFSPVPALLWGSLPGRGEVLSGYTGFTSRSCLT